MRLSRIVARLRCPCRACRELRREEREEREHMARLRERMADPDFWTRWQKMEMPASSRSWADAARAKLTEYERGSE